MKNNKDGFAVMVKLFEVTFSLGIVTGMGLTLLIDGIVSHNQLKRGIHKTQKKYNEGYTKGFADGKKLILNLKSEMDRTVKNAEDLVEKARLYVTDDVASD